MTVQRGDSMFSPRLDRHSFDRSPLSQTPATFGSLLEQGIKIFALEEAVTVHGMADGNDLAGVFPIAESVRGNAQVLSGLGYSEKILQLLHFGSPWRGDP